MRAILLAAGMGKRMAGLGQDVPKCLLPVGGEPFLVRLVRQLLGRGVLDVTVVVGYREDPVRAAVEGAIGGRVRFLRNERYSEDVNIHSLALALERDDSPFLVVESDIWIDDARIGDLFDPRDEERSVWYTRGPFVPGQRGGVLLPDPEGRVLDLRIVQEWDESLARHRKLVGVTRVGPREVADYRRLLLEARDRSTRQYWLVPWIENLGRLECFDRDLGASGACSTNTPEEYRDLVRRLDDGAHRG
ncbi:MAG: NTP transferase domain-containing protein [Deltaproteobacteria bacterium]|nr:NTP transferase domain-containing protein [Deltaproteobacteria bacterium]